MGKPWDNNGIDMENLMVGTTHWNDFIWGCLSNILDFLGIVGINSVMIWDGNDWGSPSIGLHGGENYA